MSTLKFHTYGRRTIRNYWTARDTAIATRIYYINGGVAYYELNGERFPLAEGHLYFFPHSQCLQFIQPQDTFLDHTYFNFISVPAVTSDGIIDIVLSEHKALEAIIFACNAMFDEYNVRFTDREYSNTVRKYLDIILFLINKVSPLSRTCDERVDTVVEYITRNYMNQITLSQLAAMVFLERNYFIKIFRRAMNVSPYQYLRDYRLNMAAEFLQSGLSVQETAQKTGYLSASAFSNAMKKRMGYYPQELI